MLGKHKDGLFNSLNALFTWLHTLLLSVIQEPWTEPLCGQSQLVGCTVHFLYSAMFMRHDNTPHNCHLIRRHHSLQNGIFFSSCNNEPYGQLNPETTSLKNCQGSGLNLIRRESKTVVVVFAIYHFVDWKKLWARGLECTVAIPSSLKRQTVN